MEATPLSLSLSLIFLILSFFGYFLGVVLVFVGVVASASPRATHPAFSNKHPPRT
jgi:hypothetical protein